MERESKGEEEKEETNKKRVRTAREFVFIVQLFALFSLINLRNANVNWEKIHFLTNLQAVY